jgi:hypothetical protein
MSNQEKKEDKEKSPLKQALQALKTVMEYPLKPRPITGETGL